MANYYYRIEEVTNGPFNLVEMGLLARYQQIKAETLVCQESSAEWLSLDSFAELDALLPVRAVDLRDDDWFGTALILVVVLAALLVIALSGAVREIGGEVAWVFCSLFLSGIVGAILGTTKRRWPSGFLLGVILGPIGWILLLLIQDFRAKCPQCRGPLIADAYRCRHCGEGILPTPKP